MNLKHPAHEGSLIVGMATIIMLLCLVVMGCFISAAFVLYFQKKPAPATVWLILGLISIASFYYGIAEGWIAIPKQV